jgi:hypothetical protein
MIMIRIITLVKIVHFSPFDAKAPRLWRRASDVGLDKRQTCGNTANYFESDSGRIGNEVGLYHMAPKKATGGTLDTS